MNLIALQSEFQAHGFDFIETTRTNQYLNRAYQELCGERDWPFLLTAASGAAPLAIAGLRSVAYVEDTVQHRNLKLVDYRMLARYISGFGNAGDPLYYYLDDTGGPPTTVSVYPVAANNLIVRYFAIPADLAAGNDEPVLPDRFQMGIVDGAVAFAYLDSDNYAAGQQFLGVFQGVKDQMNEQLRSREHNETERAMDAEQASA